MQMINALVKTQHKHNFSYKRHMQFLTWVPNFRGGGSADPLSRAFQALASIWLTFLLSTCSSITDHTIDDGIQMQTVGWPTGRSDGGTKRQQRRTTVSIARRDGESNSDTRSERRPLGNFSPATKTKIWQYISICGENEKKTALWCKLPPLPVWGLI